MLYFLVGSDEEGRSIPPARVVKFMQESGLMKATREGVLCITDKGSGSSSRRSSEMLGHARCRGCYGKVDGDVSV